MAVEPVAIKILDRFPVGGAEYPHALVEGRDGSLYGAITPVSIARFKKEGGHKVICNLDIADGWGLISALIAARDGNLYGLVGGVEGRIFRLSYEGRLDVVHTFTDSRTGADSPLWLIEGPDGNLYGANLAGGADQGSVFRLSLSGEFQTIAILPGSGRSAVVDSLIVGHDGALWGTTDNGVFRLTLAGEFSNPIHSGGDQYLPSFAFVAHPDGNYYGGALSSAGGGAGILWRLTPDGVFTRVAEFPNGPYAFDFFAGRDGNLYGYSNRYSALAKNSSLFRLTTGGALTTLATNFHASSAQPLALIQADNGVFYGFSAGLRIEGALFSARIPAQTTVDLPPLAREDVAVMPPPGEAVSIPVLRNDSHLGGGALMISALSVPQYGAAALDPTGTRITYRAPAGQPIVEDEFTYTLQDEQGATGLGNVIVRMPFHGSFQTLLNATDPQYQGVLKLTLSSHGALTGMLRLGGLRWQFAGALDNSNHYAATLTNTDTVQLTLDLAEGKSGPQFRTSIAYGSKTITATLGLPDLAQAKKIAGRYTVLLPPDPGWAKLPQTIPANEIVQHSTRNPLVSLSGYGFAQMKVLANGVARIVGTMPDGTPFASGNVLDAAGILPLYARLYEARANETATMEGWASGTIRFRNQPGVSDADGTLTWVIPYRHYGVYLLPKVHPQISFLASQYALPDENAPFVSGSYFSVKGGGVEPGEFAYVSVDTEGRFSSIESGLQVTGGFNPRNGLMSGHFRLRGSGVWMSFFGALYQKQPSEHGLFVARPGEYGTGLINIGTHD